MIIEIEIKNKDKNMQSYIIMIYNFRNTTNIKLGTYFLLKSMGNSIQS